MEEEAAAGSSRKVYVVAIVIHVIYTGMYVVSKAVFDGDMNTFVFIFYRQAAAMLLLLPLAVLLERRNAPPISSWLFIKIFMYALLGNTVSMNLYNVSLEYTSATSNSVLIVTFLFAVHLKLESIKLRSSSGASKLAGVALCLAGVLVIALYVGPALCPLNHHRAFTGHEHDVQHTTTPTATTAWMKGTFLMLLANVTWSLWIVLQASLLKECPNKLLVTALQCLLSTAQSLVPAAMATAGDLSQWKLWMDVGVAPWTAAWVEAWTGVSPPWTAWTPSARTAMTPSTAMSPSAAAVWAATPSAAKDLDLVRLGL